MKTKDNCSYFDKIFLDYINNSVNEQDQKFCSHHFKTCEKCKNNSEFLEVQQVWKKLDSFNDIPVANNFMAKLQHEIVLLEEKNKLFWFKLDRFVNLFRVPVTAMLIVIFSFTSNLPYAKAEKKYFQMNTLKAEMQLKEYSKKSLSDAIKDVKNIIKK